MCPVPLRGPPDRRAWRGWPEAPWRRRTWPPSLPRVVGIRHKARVLQLGAPRGKVVARHPVDRADTLQTGKRDVFCEIVVVVPRQPHHATVARIYSGRPLTRVQRLWARI